MMAIVGFILVCIIGIYLVVAGLGGWIGLGAFGGFHKTWGFLIFTVIGALILWWAFNNSPFTITVTGG
jgi:hypothetical protein